MRELRRRARARESLHTYALSVDIPTAPFEAPCPDEELLGPAELLMEKHHSAMLSAMQRCVLKPGGYGRLMMFLPPGSAKSLYTSTVLPTWYMAKFPGSRIIVTSYGDKLAERHSRRSHLIVTQQKYKDLWIDQPGLDRDAAGDWSLTNKSESLAMSLTGGMTGNRANGLIVDDPVKGREQADSELERQTTLNAYEDDAKSRLLPGAWVIIIMCMTGDTPVLMADGTEKLLRDIRPGDLVTSYDEGKMVAARVLNWKNQGRDDVFAIETESGKILRANARHPFLVERNGERSWVRVRDLRIGDRMVTVDGTGKPAPSAVSQSAPRGCAEATTINADGLTGSDRRLTIPPRDVRHGSNTATESAAPITHRSCTLRMGVALSVENLPETTSVLTGAESSASITTTQPDACEDCSATTAISSSGTGSESAPCGEPRPTFSTTKIRDIRPHSREDVFDIQVERTENFIANGCVSHNTRWHEQDLAGSILPDDYDGRSGVIRCKDGMDWEVLNIPAKCERDDDPLGRKPGEYLWTSFYGENHWKMYEDAAGPESARRWASLYQQRPSPQGSGRFNESMFDFYDPDELPPLNQLTPVGASDHAVTSGKNDFTEAGVFGVDTRGDLWELDWWHAQCDTGEATEKVLDFIKKWRIAMWFNEGGVIDKAMRPLFNRRQRERKIYCDFRSIPSMQDKVAKCSSFQGRAATGTVHFRNNANSRRVVAQLVALPAGRYDDAADVCGLIGRAIDQFHVPRLHVPPERKILKPFTAEWLEHEEKAEKRPRYR